ncbi:MAG: CDP-2,3-bis-(O-geranylgeranyl)-sn-glycerol synthase [Gammaproteobacteria bacterium]|nr:MAG: CDP-2,3-bis-(O-geranylgeranyl)-sn-glycerol synthase [Gammaproteobacteria bacterium]
MLVIKILFLLLLANGTPVIAKKLLGPRLAYPLDGGKIFVDGRPWFGASKTVRGIIFSIFVTSVGAVLIGYSIQSGVLFATASMAGDLVSSFIKRRLGLPPSSRALGLDQLPESILPLLFCWQTLGLDMPTATTVVVIFFVGELILSRVLFRLHVRDHPY